MSRLHPRRWSVPIATLSARSASHCALAWLALASACAGSPEGAEGGAEAASGPSGDDVAEPDATPPPAAGGSSGDDAATPGSDANGSGAEGVDTGLELSPEQVATEGAGSGGAEPGSPAPAPDPASDPAPAATGPVTVFLAGDSIVQSYPDTASDRDQAGWGQMLQGLLDERVTVVNRAIGGRTARRFIDEGRLSDLVDELEPGSFLLVQFGTNDGNRTATYTLGDETIPYFLDPATDFKVYLQRYVDAALSRSAAPVFVTPTPRNSAYCTGGNGTGGHAAAMKELAQASGVPVVDLNARAVAYLREICPAPTPESFFLLRADGSVDGTHFQENGARILAGFVADGLREAGLALTAEPEAAR
jgi:lysophospholipase L1-like esterase